jgi:type VI secretion system protein ImpH
MTDAPDDSDPADITAPAIIAYEEPPGVEADAPMHPVLAAIAAEPWRFDLFYALRLLETVYADRPRLGTSTTTADDPIRLGQAASLEFAPATIAGFTPPADGEPARLDTWSFGYFGPNGPLPLHMTEWAMDRIREGDTTLTAFADIFHHRFLSLFQRAWAISEPTVGLDRPGEDHFARWVASLCGYGEDSLRHRDAMPDFAKLHFAGRLAAQTRNAEGLEAVLAGFFGLPVRIEEFVGAWMIIPVENRTRLGGPRIDAEIGRGATVGARAWGRRQKFRCVFGPVSLNDYRRLLPGGDSLMRLIAVIRNYIGDELQWDVNIALDCDEVPVLRLGGIGSRLGWTTWIGYRLTSAHAADLCLDPLAILAAAPAAGRPPTPSEFAA